MFRAPETMVAEPTMTPTNKVPVLFLKTKSSPTDAYEDLFNAQPLAGRRLEPRFVPVLRHSFKDAEMARVERVLRARGVSSKPGASYGGMIFTSQRAVEAFSAIVGRGRGSDSQAGSLVNWLVTDVRDIGDADAAWPHLQDVPIYSVGPATTRALRAIPQNPPLQVFGEDSGTGEVLSGFMLDHYKVWYNDRDTLPPLLFLTGETRRDVIPKRLMDPDLPAGRRIGVDEVEVYETGVMESFPADLARTLEETRAANML